MHAHLKTVDYVKRIAGTDDEAALLNCSSDFFKSKRATFFHSLKGRTGEVLAKAAES